MTNEDRANANSQEPTPLRDRFGDWSDDTGSPEIITDYEEAPYDE